MTTRNLGLTIALIASLALGACGAKEETEAAPTVETPAAATPPAEAAPAEAAPAAEEAPAPAPADGDTMTVAALRDAFTADQAAWIGREVTVRGLFFSATSMNGSVNNISMLATRDDDFMSSLVCGFGDDAPASVDLTQYHEVTVRGTVRERFRRAALEDCTIVSQ